MNLANQAATWSINLAAQCWRCDPTNESTHPTTTHVLVHGQHCRWRLPTIDQESDKAHLFAGLCEHEPSTVIVAGVPDGRLNNTPRGRSHPASLERFENAVGRGSGG